MGLSVGGDGCDVLRDVQVCVVSLRILNGERSRGGGGKGCDGVVARAVERQRTQLRCWRDFRSNPFQQLDCRSIGVAEAMAGDVYVM